MYALYTILVLLLWASPSNQISADLTYKELEELDATCHMLDSCNVRRSSDSLEKYTCQCGSYCANLETCCVDAPLRARNLAGQKQTCRPVNGKYKAHYFMLDQCSPHNMDKQMEKLCTEDWNKDDNVLPLVPVTSKSSNATYKNYFCFRCNEATDDFLSWNVKLNSGATPNNLGQEAVPTYDTNRQTWMAHIDKDSYIPVRLFIEIPDEIRKIPNMCVTNAISSCSRQWKIRDVEFKCSQYTSYIFIVRNGIKVSYKNPHCALCNFESLEKMGCGITKRTKSKKLNPFSFRMLPDITISDGDKVDQKQLCDSNSIWDPYLKKCRAPKCAIPGYIVKDRKCVRGINISDGDKVGIKELCDSNSAWDPFFKKCRTITCALPGYIVKDRKCIRGINISDGDKVGIKELCDSNSAWDPFFKKCRTITCAIPGNIVKDRKCVRINISDGDKGDIKEL